MLRYSVDLMFFSIYALMKSRLLFAHGQAEAPTAALKEVNDLFGAKGWAPLTPLGPLPEYAPPADCNIILAYDTEIARTRISIKNVGCDIVTRKSCCPPNFTRLGYYQANNCPLGYTTTATARYIVEMNIGGLTGSICCPVLAKSYAWSDAPLRFISTPYVNERGTYIPSDLNCIWTALDKETPGLFKWRASASAVIIFPTHDQIPTNTKDSPFQVPILPTAIPSNTPAHSNPTATKTFAGGGASDQVTRTLHNTNPAATPTDTYTVPSTSTFPTEKITRDGSTSTRPSSDDTSNVADEGTGLSLGAAAGIAAGVCLPVMSIILFIVFSVCTSRNSKEQQKSKTMAKDITTVDNLGNLGVLKVKGGRNRAQYSPA